MNWICLKGDLKGATDIDTSTLASKTDNVAVDKLKTVPANVSKLSNLVDNDVAKKICVSEIGYQSQDY